MAAKIYYQEDCNLSLLEGQKIAIIGYGSQGHAHALNLKESGCDVIIGLYEGSKSWAKAEHSIRDGRPLRPDGGRQRPAEHDLRRAPHRPARLEPRPPGHRPGLPPDGVGGQRP